MTPTLDLIAKKLALAEDGSGVCSHVEWKNGQCLNCGCLPCETDGYGDGK